MKRIALYLATLALTVAACAGDAVGTEATISGTYALQSINGNALPAVGSTSSSGTVYVDAGSITLNGNGTFTSKFTQRLVLGSSTTPITENEAGTYSQVNNTITFTYADGSKDTAAYTTNTLTLTADGKVGIFKK